MTLLSVRLLGGFQVKLNDAPIDGFRTQKARALLAYLTAEAGRVHTRAFLSGLLWPDQTDARARAYLRGALAELRAMLGDQCRATPFLLATTQSLQFNPAADHWVDVVALQAGLSHGAIVEPAKTIDNIKIDDSTIHNITEAVNLYRGRFLEGFFLKGNTAFEEWQLMTAESLRRQVVEALAWLTTELERAGNQRAALRHAWRRAELEPLSDGANQDVMRLLAATDDANAALAHYDRFAILLTDDLEVTPASETVQLAAQIRAGQIPHAHDHSDGCTEVLPPFLPEINRGIAPSPFVARDTELTQLHDHLEAALAGQGRVVFVAGDAGQGKTSLLREFGRQAVADQENLIAVAGRCSNFHNIGDPYLPFREILAQLSGDFAAQWEAGDIDRRNALRLWQTAPTAVDALLTHAPDLIDTFLPAAGLLERLSAMPHSAEQRETIDDLLARRTAQSRPGTQQQALFDQYTHLLQTLARRQPLLLMLEDLHWSDMGSMALLFHLGQRLAGCRALIVGTYRPEDLSASRRHPLTVLIAEFQRRYGPIVIDLNNAVGCDFVEAYVDLEPNHLGEAFRNTLLEVSGGHPLYTVELLRDMRADGSLFQDDAGYWCDAPALNWRLLPARVEATIGQRIERLPTEMRALLDAGAVQGGEFNVDVVASVVGESGTDALRLFREMEQRHRLVTSHGSRRVGRRRVIYLRFAHILFREYLLAQMDEAFSMALNEAVAVALEALVAGLPEERSAAAGRLAWHYQLAKRSAKAAAYCVEAGNEALRLYAYDQATDHFETGMRLIEVIPEDDLRLALELKLLIGVGTVVIVADSAGAPSLALTWLRARRLAEQVGTAQQRFQVLWYEWQMRFLRGEMRTALTVAEACVTVARETGSYLLQSYVAIGPTLYRLGKMKRAYTIYREALALCTERPEACHSELVLADLMVDTKANGSIALWYVGYPDCARAQNTAGLAAARSLAHPYSLAFALSFAASLYQRASMPAETERYAREAIEFNDEQGFALWSGIANLYCGWARVAQGELASGLQQAREGLDAVRATGMEHIRFAAVLADAYLRCGEIQPAMTIVEDLLVVVARTGEREWEAELHRLQGELLLARGADNIVIEACFEKAVAVAAAQQARSLQLRATVSLARLLRAEGRSHEAAPRLDAIYNWFSEGHDTPDMLAAADLLVELAYSSRSTVVESPRSLVE